MEKMIMQEMSEANHPPFLEGALFGIWNYNHFVIFTGVLVSIDKYGFNIYRTNLKKATNNFLSELPVDLQAHLKRATHFLPLDFIENVPKKL
jgi:hypothetical protein